MGRWNVPSEGFLKLGSCLGWWGRGAFRKHWAPSRAAVRPQREGQKRGPALSQHYKIPARAGTEFPQRPSPRRDSRGQRSEGLPGRSGPFEALAPCVNSHGIERKEWSLIYILGNVTGPPDDEEGAAEGQGGPLTLTSLPQGAWGPLPLRTVIGDPQTPTRRGAPWRSLCFTISVFTLNSRTLV